MKHFKVLSTEIQHTEILYIRILTPRHTFIQIWNMQLHKKYKKKVYNKTTTGFTLVKLRILFSKE